MSPDTNAAAAQRLYERLRTDEERLIRWMADGRIVAVSGDIALMLLEETGERVKEAQRLAYALMVGLDA